MAATLNDGWVVTTPEEVGINSAQLFELDNFLEQWPKHSLECDHGWCDVTILHARSSKYFAAFPAII